MSWAIDVGPAADVWQTEKNKTLASRCEKSIANEWRGTSRRVVSLLVVVLVVLVVGLVEFIEWLPFPDGGH